MSIITTSNLEAEIASLKRTVLHLDELHTLKDMRLDARGETNAILRKMLARSDAEVARLRAKLDG